MNDADETRIRDRIRFLLAEALEQRVAEASKRLPKLCKHNHQNPLDTRRQVYGESNDGFNRITVAPGEAVTQSIGLCMLGAKSPEEWPGTICEDPVDAQRCPYFEPIMSKEAVWADFHKMLHQDHARLRTELPEVYGLLWALNGFASELQVPWWKRLWFWFLRVRVEPLAAMPEDAAKLLLPARSESDPS